MLNKIKSTVFAAAVVAASWIAPASAQSGCPAIVYGAVLTAAQWNDCFARKQNTLGYVPVNKAGDVMLGKLATTPATTSQSGFAIQTGASPLSPKEGDLWSTTAGLYSYLGAATRFVPLPPTSGTLTTVLHGNASGFSSYSPVDLATDTIGTLPSGSFPALSGAVTTTAGSTVTLLSDNAVTTTKIVDANVTTAKIADSNVTAVKIADANVTNAKLANSAAYTFKGNATGSTASPQDFTIGAMTNKTSPTSSDLLIISDQAAAGATKNATLAAVVALVPNYAKGTTTKTANYTVLSTENGTVFFGDATSGTVTFTLPSAVTVGSGFRVIFKKIDSSANLVTLSGVSAQTIDGQPTRSMRLQYQSVAIVSDGANWNVMSEGSVFASGSNANGNYIRFSDGTQEVWFTTTTASVAISTAYFGGFRSGGQSWTFPMPFSAISTARVTAQPSDLTAFGAQPAAAASTTGVSYIYTSVTSDSAASRTIVLRAIGPWY